MEFGSEPSDVKLRLLGRQGAARAHRASRRGPRPGVPAADRQAGQAAGRHRSGRRRPAVDARSRGRADPPRPRRRLDAGGVAADHRRHHRAAAHVLRDRDGSATRWAHPRSPRRKGRRAADDAVGAGGQARHVLDGRRQRRRSDCCRSFCRRPTSATSRSRRRRSNTTTPRGWRIVRWVTAAAGAALVALTIVAAGSRTSTLRRLVIDTLAERLDSEVELQFFSVDLFPDGRGPRRRADRPAARAR